MFNFLFNFIRCFSRFLGCVRFSKVEYCVLDFSFNLFAFHLISIKLESGFRKNDLSSFKLGLIWFEYRGSFLYLLLVLRC